MKSPLIVKLTGPEVDEGRVSLEHLDILIRSLKTSIDRFTLSQSTKSTNEKLTRNMATQKEHFKLYLVDFRKGSADLIFEAQDEQMSIYGKSPSREILSGWIREVNRTLLLPEKTEEKQDKRFVSSLLRLNSILKNGINTLEIEYEWPEAPMQVKLDKTSKKKFETILLPPNIDTFAVEGVVLEADFHAAFVNFTLYRTDGSPIRCIASQDDASTVMDSLMHYVKVRGDARRNRVGEILDFAVRSIEIEGEASLTDFDMGKVVEFWRGNELDNLISVQQVREYSGPQEDTWEPPSDDEWERYLEAIKKKEKRGLFD